MTRRIVLAIPGSILQRTGGYIFARRVVEGLRAQGRHVDVAELSGRFPLADNSAREAAAAALAQAPADAVVVIDGLALPAFDHSLIQAVARRPVLGFIHHPLALETGLSPGQAARLGGLETALWSRLYGLVCASPNTARLVQASGISPRRIAIAEPGVDLPSSLGAVARPQRVGPVRLLCVATVTPRKNHRMLIEALAQVRSKDWQLDCIGSLERDPATADSLRAAITARGLSDRITLHGEQPEDRLEHAWREADLFVLASDHEGYGMVFTEALARAVPIVATRVGAVPETIPAAACQLVAPGDTAALAAVLESLITSSEARQRLAEGARAARAALVPWPLAAERWAAAVDQLCTERIQ